jgi:RHS repeat-associated protein
MENGLSATYYCDARHYSSGRFLTRDPVRGKFSEPMTLHQYLYCMNDPINRIDPTGEFFGFLGSMWARGKNAAASITAEKWAEETIIGAASVWNGLTQGYLNVLFGPGDMSDKAKFWVGFVGGFGEMQVGMRTGSAALGATVASTFTSAANSALSESTEFISIGTAVNIGLSAAMGAFGDWAADGLDPFTLWAIGVDAAMAGGLGQMGYEYTYGD